MKNGLKKRRRRKDTLKSARTCMNLLTFAAADHSQATDSNLCSVFISSAAMLAHKSERDITRLPTSCLSLEPLDNVARRLMTC